MPVPLALTLMVATVPAHTVVLAGCVVTVIGVFSEITALPAPTLEQPFASRTLAIVYVVATFGLTVIVPLKLLNVAVVPSFKVTTNGAVPVSATLKVALPLAQIVWLPLSVAVGSGFTATVATAVVKPLVRTHPFASVTLTNV
jgi:hypothetical protein